MSRAFGRFAGPLLVLAGIVALARHEHQLEQADALAVIYVFCTAAGLALWLWKHRVLKWLAASLPFWSLANAAGWAMFLALALTIGSVAVLAVGPTLPGRRLKRCGEPLVHLANGPVAPVQSAAYAGGRRSRALGIAAWVFTGLALVLFLLAAASVSVELNAALALSSAIIGSTFFFGNWFADRVRLRIDEEGLHARTLFREETIPWRDVAGVFIRHVYLPGYGMRLRYFVVFSPTREFAFPETMHGASELKTSIEAALGVQWPEAALLS